MLELEGRKIQIHTKSAFYMFKKLGINMEAYKGPH